MKKYEEMNEQERREAVEILNIILQDCNITFGYGAKAEHIIKVNNYKRRN